MFSGLNGAQNDIDDRRHVYGPNTIPPKKPVSFLRLCWEAAQDTTLIILMISSLVSIILYLVTKFAIHEDDGDASDTEWIDSVAIMVCVIFVVVISAGNDYLKERQFRALQKKIASDHSFAVCRGGQIVQVLVSDIVVGDVCQVGISSLRLNVSSYISK